MNDIADNQYNERQIYADPSAAYVGEWTAATDIGFRSIKVKADGKIKECLSPSSGTTEGKVYIEEGSPAFMIKNGAKTQVVSIEEDLFYLNRYGEQEKYYAGPVPDACATAFKNFR